MPIRMTGLNSGLDTESIIKELVSAKSVKITSMKKAQTKLSWKQDAWKTLNSKIYSLYTDTVSDLRWSSTFAKKKTESSDSSVLSVIAGSEAAIGVQEAHVVSLAKAAYLTGGEISTADGGKVSASTRLTGMGISSGEKISVTTNGKTYELDVTEETTVNDLLSKFKEAGLNASLDEGNQRLFVSAKETGAAHDFTFGGNTAALSALGLVVDGSDNTAVKIDASDAELVLNKVHYKSSSNNIVVNGSTYQLKGVSAKNEDGSYRDTTVTTENDLDGMYDTVKSFITKYNELINEMDKLYNADSSKGYEPLTSDEKKEMSDSEIEDWEKKIKESLLRRDSTLSDVSSAMEEVMGAGYTIGGKTYYLSSFGINTLGYFTAADNEKHAYHIDGDKDDSSTSGNTDILKTMITNEPKTVIDFFQQLNNSLYTKLTEKMGANSMRSIYKAYNDKQMKQEYDDYTSDIAEQEEKLKALQDKWYEKFSAMETALAKLSSKTSAIAGLLG